MPDVSPPDASPPVASPPVLRFAPSPTGLLHVGNARTALLNALIARRRGGTFILRLDDTDAARSRAEFADAIAADLDWLGIPPDIRVRQSDRLGLYAEAAERLKAAGRLYPCYESEEELDLKRKLQRARGLPPVYDRAALRLTEAERSRFAAEGRAPHWRFLLAHRDVAWDDGVRGPQRVDTASLSDPVLVRADGSFLYTLPSVVDDIALGVTQVVRGEDHVTNTAVQIEIIEALGGTPPLFAHHNLLTLPSGEGLSKRLGHLSLSALRADGIEPLALAAAAVLVGTAHAVQPVASLDELAAVVDLASISRAPARFDPQELAGLTARTLHAMPFAAARARLLAQGIEGGEAFWLAVRGNLARFEDAAHWWRVCRQPLANAAAPEDAAFLADAAALLPPEPWGEATYGAWIAALKAASGRSGKALFQPLRRALTGADKGPELAGLLPLMGRARVDLRLRGSEKPL
ncbi:glutamate--tRNA ligase [Xanthobacter tagetidis]|uniref:Glutamate--tRNA ligase n=1 Tax=Xanthobacter tagetidis TaxID=60216 RepID=A0A3L7A358_9HYPH|nr:glutamate--tRNA ligase [Xanthobacter tagetidis]MBB6307724.1 glutamyl-tRNA synthetase [Xanthobacter tagetidis]RLP74465.1 glutamate--tRNA ligase [Xanthobacter tagetidis]